MKQVGVIVFGGGLNIREWYNEARKQYKMVVWADNMILLYN